MGALVKTALLLNVLTHVPQDFDAIWTPLRQS